MTHDQIKQRLEMLSGSTVSLVLKQASGGTELGGILGTLAPSSIEGCWSIRSQTLVQAPPGAPHQGPPPGTIQTLEITFGVDDVAMLVQVSQDTPRIVRPASKILG